MSQGRLRSAAVFAAQKFCGGSHARRTRWRRSHRGRPSFGSSSPARAKSENGQIDSKSQTMPTSRATYLGRDTLWTRMPRRDRFNSLHGRTARVFHRKSTARAHEKRDSQGLCDAPLSKFGAHTRDPHIPVKPASAPFQRAAWPAHAPKSRCDLARVSHARNI